MEKGRKCFLFNDALNTFIYGYMASDMVKDHSDSERRNPLPISSKGSFIMHHPTDRIAHTTAFVTPVVEHWLEREIAQWVHPMKDRSDDPSHHERTLLPRSYISLNHGVPAGSRNSSMSPLWGLTPYITMNKNVLSVSLNKTFPSFHYEGSIRCPTAPSTMELHLAYNKLTAWDNSLQGKNGEFCDVSCWESISIRLHVRLVFMLPGYGPTPL